METQKKEIVVLLLVFGCSFFTANAQKTREKPTSTNSNQKNQENREKTMSTPIPSLSAADNSYSGAAKMYVSNYYKQQADAQKFMEKEAISSLQNKIEQMEKSMASVKTKDATYSTAAMEKDIKSIQAWYEANKDNQAKKMASQHDADWAGIHNRNDLDALFKNPMLKLGSASISNFPQLLKEYNTKAEELLKKDPFSVQNNQYSKEGMEGIVTDFMTKSNGFLTQNQNLLKEATKLEDYEADFYELRLYQAYWDAAQKFFPNQAPYAQMYQKISTQITQVGSIEDIKKTVEKNRIEKIKSTKMPQAALNDATLEKAILDGFNRKFKDSAKKTGLKVVITSTDWITERNPLTSVIIGRRREARIAYKAENGKCYLAAENILLYEEYIGGKFTNQQVIYKYITYEGEEMLCENVR